MGDPMKEKKRTFLLLVCFLFFSFFSCVFYEVLLDRQQRSEKNRLREAHKKNSELNVLFTPSKEVIYNEDKTTKLKHSYYDINITIPGNKAASSNIEQYMRKLMQKSTQKIRNVTDSVRKEYNFYSDIGLLYMNNKVLSFYNRLTSEDNKQTIDELVVFSFNRNTGARLRYKDISTNPQQLLHRIKKKTIKTIKQEYNNIFLSKMDYEIKKENFYLDDTKLVIVYSRCSVVDCFYGNLFIEIPYKEIRDLLIDKYY